MPTVLMHTRPLDEKEKIVTGPRVAWLPPYLPAGLMAPLSGPFTAAATFRPLSCVVLPNRGG